MSETVLAGGVNDSNLSGAHEPQEDVEGTLSPADVDGPRA